MINLACRQKILFDVCVTAPPESIPFKGLLVSKR